MFFTNPINDPILFFIEVTMFVIFVIGVFLIFSNDDKNGKNKDLDRIGHNPLSEDDIKIYQDSMATPGSWYRALVIINTPRGYKSIFFDDGTDSIMDDDDYLVPDEIDSIMSKIINIGYRKIDTTLYRKNYGIYLEGECTKKKI